MLISLFRITDIINAALHLMEIVISAIEIADIAIYATKLNILYWSELSQRKLSPTSCHRPFLQL